MSGFPFTSLAQQFNLYPQYYTVDSTGQPLVQQNVFNLQGNPLPPFQQEHVDPNAAAAAFGDPDDPSKSMTSSQGATRGRKRLPGEQAKFRRTRSGCYTCRTRRVKCDETRPTCDRCRKGNRDCVYPDPAALQAAAKARSAAKSKTTQEEASSPDSVSGGDGENDLAPQSAISTTAASNLAGNMTDTGSDMSPIDETRSSVPSITSGTSIRGMSVSSASPMPDLPEDILFFMRYAKANLTFWHWNYTVDGSDFLHNSVLETALDYEPLLYAVTCFSAYNYTLQQPNGKIQDFLKYHSMSVIALRKSLKARQQPNHATLLTILQLATIEECMGDWANLMSHQKAAHQVLTSLYTPQATAKNPILRQMLKWYVHFDTYVGMLSDYASTIDRSYLEEAAKVYAQELKAMPDNIILMYEERSAWMRVITHDIFGFFAKMSSGQMLDAEFDEKVMSIQAELASWESQFPSALVDPAKLVTDFSGAPPPDPEDIFDPYEPGLIFGGDVFASNQFRLGLEGMRHMLATRYAAWKGLPKPEETSELAHKIKKVVNAIQYWPGSPSGALLSMKAYFSYAILLQPPTTEKEITWCRKKFAVWESLGSIYPTSFRAKLEAVWGIDMSEWWLSDEKPPSVVKQIREFINERQNIHQDTKSTSVREMRGIFNTLNLSDASSPESVASPSSGSAARQPSDPRSPTEEYVPHNQESPPVSWSFGSPDAQQ